MAKWEFIFPSPCLIGQTMYEGWFLPVTGTHSPKFPYLHFFFARADRSSIFYNVQRYCGSTLATCYQRHNLQYRYYNLYNTRRLLDNGFKHFCNLKKLKYWFEKQKFTSYKSHISNYSYTKRCVPHCFGVRLGCQNSVDCSHKRS